MILSVNDLSLCIRTMRGSLPVLRGVSLAVEEGEVLGIVGESGCGKSTLVLALSGLLSPGAVIHSGSVRISGREILNAEPEVLRTVRTREIAYIFQDPQSSLNPVLTVFDQLAESVSVADKEKSADEIRSACRELLKQVRIDDPDRVLSSWPHELSGGMKQRVMIAMALARSPRILIADEPTTALDVTVQSEILKLLLELNRSRGLTIIYITHDLAAAEKICTRIAVMYAGVIVETGTSSAVAGNPRHPYTSMLWKSIPGLTKSTGRLSIIPGSVPNPSRLPDGCKFHPRCFNAQETCRESEPPFVNDNGAGYRCHYPLS